MKMRQGHYRLPDGSRVYRSGAGVNPGRWFAWVREPGQPDRGGRAARGRILMGAGGILYFDTPEEAAAAVEREGGRR